MLSKTNLATHYANTLIREYLTAKPQFSSLLPLFNECNIPGDLPAITSKAKLCKCLGVEYKKDATTSVLEMVVEELIHRKGEGKKSKSKSKSKNEDKGVKKDAIDAWMSSTHHESTKVASKKPTEELTFQDIDIESDDDFLNSQISSTQPLFQKTTSTLITTHQCIQLRTLIFGNPTKKFNSAWKYAGFDFSKDIPYGLVQTKGGPCGLFAVVQGYIVKYLLEFGFE